MKIWFKNPTGDLWKLVDTCLTLANILTNNAHLNVKI